LPGPLVLKHFQHGPEARVTSSGSAGRASQQSKYDWIPGIRAHRAGAKLHVRQRV
jgi:hypothetical protein